MRTASVHLCRQWIGPASAATTVFGVVGAVGLIAAQLLRAPAMPTAEGLARVAVACLPVLGEWVLPLGGLAGLALLLARWRAEGEWLALQAAGVSGRHLVAPALLGGLLLSGGTAALTHQGGPWGRATLFDVLLSQVALTPGKATTLGQLTLLPGEVDSDGLADLFVSHGQGSDLLVAHARTGALSPDRTLVLEHGTLWTDAGAAEFGRLTVPLPEASRRAAPSAWPGTELAASADPYHRALWHKRSVWPAAGAVLLLLALPCTLVGRGWTLPLAVVGWWAAVRVCDGLVVTLGGALAALLPLVALCGVTVAVWWRWEGR